MTRNSFRIMVDYYDDKKNLKLLFNFFHFFTVIIKRVQLQLETRYFDTVKSILKQVLNMK